VGDAKGPTLRASLERLSAALRAPTTGSDDADLLRTRLSLLGKVGVAIALPFNVVGVVLDLIGGDRTLVEALVADDNLVPLGVTLLLLALWRLPARLPITVVLWLDLTFLPLVDALFYWAASHIDSTPPASLATLAFVFAALARAIVVPSTPVRTALTTAVGALPTAIGAWWLLENVGNLRVPQTALTGLWHFGAVVLSTVTSSVIYGLRREVDQALRLGQYTLLEKIGEGGMGEVYLARHALLRRPTAVKLLRGERGGPKLVERFEREVQLTSQLTHPNTISVYDYGRTPDGTFYYAMEYLDGLTLHELVTEDGPQPAGRVARLLFEVCDALAEAHQVGLIHRDVKPANVFVCERGGRSDVVKVVDFGLVKAIDSLMPSVTATNAVIGTPLVPLAREHRRPERHRRAPRHLRRRLPRLLLALWLPALRRPHHRRSLPRAPPRHAHPPQRAHRFTRARRPRRFGPRVLGEKAIGAPGERP
jgi:eukaryotic-like serine/threonine-protein kinase